VTVRFGLLSILGIVAFSSLPAGCGPKGKSQPAKPQAFNFVDATQTAGIRFTHRSSARRPLDIVETTGSGLAWLDYDADGDLDLYCIKGNAGPDESDALYRNRGDGTFEEVTQQAGIRPGGYGMGCAAGDYDGDGWVDLYVTRFGPNVLYRNRGDGTFEEVARQAGVRGRDGSAIPDWSLGAVWFDADDDADLDLYVSHYLDFGPKALRHCRFGEALATCNPHHYEAQSDRFYRNNGNGTFTDATEPMGFQAVEPGRGMAALAFRPDPAGPLALYVANDTTQNFLFVRQKNGKYRDEAFDRGCALSATGSQLGSMGLDSGDTDGDGLPDLLVGTFQHQSKPLFQNLGGATFEDASDRVGLGVQTWNYLTFGCGMLDADLDGDLDVVFGNGHVQDTVAEFDRSATYAQRSQLFRNQGGRFEELTDQAGAAFQQLQVVRGLAFGDYDNDGDEDIAVSVSGGPVQIWRNDTSQRGNWLQVDLKGRKPNVEALGAVVTLTVGGKRQISEIRSGRSYLADCGRRLTFGLGAASTVERLEVRWPGGKVQVLKDLPANQVVRMAEAP